MTGWFGFTNKPEIEAMDFFPFQQDGNECDPKKHRATKNPTKSPQRTIPVHRPGLLILVATFDLEVGLISRLSSEQQSDI